MRTICLALAAACLAVAACEEPAGGPYAAGGERRGEKLETNIISIAAFFTHNPFGPVGGSNTPGGFRIGALYLSAPVRSPEGKTGEEGVFADGIIHVYMYEVQGGPKTRTERLAREWLFDAEQARPYRSKKKTAMGYGYQLHCAWGDADVLGKNVEVQINFERTDGRVISSRRYGFKVPTVCGGASMVR